MAEKYVARLHNNVLRAFGEDEIKTMLMMGALDRADWIFCLNRQDWIRPLEIKSLVADLPPARPGGQTYEKPDFKPPHVLMPEAPQGGKTAGFDEWKRIKELEDELQDREKVIGYFKSLLEKQERETGEVERVNAEYMDALVEKENQITELTEKVDILTGDFERIEKSYKDLQDKYARTYSSFKDVDHRVEELEEENQRLRHQNVDLTNELKNTLGVTESYSKDIKKYKVKLKELQHNNSQVEEELAKFKQHFINQKGAGDKMKVEVEKLQRMVVKLNKEKRKAKIQINDLNKFKHTLQVKEEQELQKLIGDSFEVNNEPIWYLQLEGQDKGPYKYEDMYDFLRFKKIDRKTLVKKKGDKDWQPVAACFEFSEGVVMRELNEEGKKVRKFFLKRSGFRAPFYDVGVAEIDGKEFRGYCTSLSVGGSFIEFPRIDKEYMQVGKTITVRIVEGTLSEEIKTPAIIRNVSEKRPRGIGLQFIGLGDEEKEIIEEFINNYMKSTEKAA